MRFLGFHVLTWVSGAISALAILTLVVPDAPAGLTFGCFGVNIVIMLITAIRNRRAERLAVGRRELIRTGRAADFKRCTCPSFSRPQAGCPICGPLMRGEAA